VGNRSVRTAGVKETRIGDGAEENLKALNAMMKQRPPQDSSRLHGALGWLPLSVWVVEESVSEFKSRFLLCAKRSLAALFCEADGSGLGKQNRE
jgi:hypothetical protein